LTAVCHSWFIPAEEISGAAGADGRRPLDEIEGLRMYLCVAKAERMNMSDAPQVTPDLFEKLQPYAIALDVEEPWSRALAAHLRRAGERPGSY